MTQVNYRHEIYNFIIEYFKENMLVPNVREIVRATNCSSNSVVHKHMKKLLSEGELNKIGGRYALPRAVVIDIVREIEEENYREGNDCGM
jgi:SOS-response transcriptional repressor LexA